MVKNLTENINFTIAKYIILPNIQFKDWIEPRMSSKVLLDRYISLKQSRKKNINKAKKHYYSPHITDMDPSEPSLWTFRTLVKYDDLNYHTLCLNSSKWAKKLLEKENNYNYDNLAKNDSDWAVEIIKHNTDKLSLDGLNRLCYNKNPLVKDILLGQPYLIDNISLSFNKSDWVHEIYLDHPKLIDWGNLALNPNAWAEQLHYDNDEGINIDELLFNESEWAIKLLSITKLTKKDYKILENNNGIFDCNISKTNKYYKLFDRFIYLLN